MSRLRFEHVSKEFALHRQRSRSFQELFLNTLHLRPGPEREHFWALSDVSFGVEPGEMIGLIGSNGAGKSTVLKLISRIIQPTSGTIEVEGRIGALLELGTGFHPDLTGRENIYLNGSILGLSKAQVDGILDDIVDFSEMERFIDVPVKHYSSGMYMRLGFSVAIHVQPEILLVDEVLAVGDQAFQLRCLDRVYELKRQGVSIVLVTHSLDKVREMCDRALWLDDGKVRAEGPVEQVLSRYLDDVYKEDEKALLRAEAREPAAPLPAAQMPAGQAAPAGQRLSASRWGSGEAEIVHVELLDAQGQDRRSFRTGESLRVRIHFLARQRIERPQFGVALFHSSGFHVNGPNTVFAGLAIAAIEGRGFLDYVIGSLPFLEGTYLLTTTIYNHEGTHAYDHHNLSYTFRVRPDEAVNEKYGFILIPSTWKLGPPGDGNT